MRFRVANLPHVLLLVMPIFVAVNALSVVATIFLMFLWLVLRQCLLVSILRG